MIRAKVIGVTRDNQVYGSGHIPPLFFYAPQPPFIDEYRQLLASAVSDAASVKELGAFALDPGLILTVGTMESFFGGDSIVSSARVASEVAAALGAVSLLLAARALRSDGAFRRASDARVRASGWLWLRQTTPPTPLSHRYPAIRRKKCPFGGKR
ncbi:MAG: hypothetical protein J2P21_27880 [Chloracidobacterium sp.]|nr:hypothetical protein [Chloracidobacterium sp.]